MFYEPAREIFKDFLSRLELWRSAASCPAVQWHFLYGFYMEGLNYGNGVFMSLSCPWNQPTSPKDSVTIWFSSANPKQINARDEPCGEFWGYKNYLPYLQSSLDFF